MYFSRIQPTQALKSYIECYWMLSLPAETAALPQRMPADGRIELMFSFAAPTRRIAMDKSDDCLVTARSYILGARGQGYSFHHPGALHYVAVRFRPGGLSAFTRLPAVETTDLHVPLDALWDAAPVRDLESRLYAAESSYEQARLLDAALLQRLNPPQHLLWIQYAVAQLESGDVTLTMPDLASRLYISQKHMERLFARYIGFRPSLYARIVRFQQAMYLAMQQPGAVTLGQLAAFAGYYDQAHFTKDFKRFSGSPPQDFLAQPHSFVRITTPPEVVDFLQD
jgi:AraC-like DNA-binding protein